MNNTSPKNLFCEKRKQTNETRALRIDKPDADFLAREAVLTILERLAVKNRDFPIAVNLFSPSGTMPNALTDSGKVKKVISVHANASAKPGTGEIITARDNLAFEEKSANLITSVFGLHWSNNLPIVLKQIRHTLQDDGLFMAALPGDKTLTELRDCLITAETRLTGNASLRVDPFGEIRQYGSLLQQAGFALPVIDSDVFCVRYKSMRHLIDDLRAMGVTSCLAQRSKFTNRELFKLAGEIYQEKYTDPDGKIRATFEIVYLSGWAPHRSQQQPLKPGSAKHKLSDFL